MTKIANAILAAGLIPVMCSMNQTLATEYLTGCDIGSAIKNRTYSEKSSKIVKGWVFKVDDPKSVSGKSTLFNILRMDRLGKTPPPSDYITDYTVGGSSDRNQGVFGVRTSSGGYMYVVLNNYLTPDTRLECTNYKNGTITVYNLSKEVEEVKEGWLGIGERSVREGFVGKRLKAIGITKEIRQLTFDDEYGSGL